MAKSKKILITGGAGFIRSALVRHIITKTDISVINVDALTYAGNLQSLREVESDSRYHFEHCNICDIEALRQLFKQHRPDAVMHLAAESHVDRSIDGPAAFIQTNIVGTFQLLQTAYDYWCELDKKEKADFRFHHISTDEVYGSLGKQGLFREDTAYQPNSPYSASKASSDHLVRAWFHTYSFPTVTSNCSNNYGPFQFPEKLIPLVILNALSNKSLPVYGNGENVRDWLYVQDHVEALLLVLQQGKPGETYNIGGHNEKTNIQVVRAVCSLLDELVPAHRPYAELIEFVKDRPGHDLRYAIDAGKIKRELNWTPTETFDSGLRKTVNWYIANREWCQHVLDGSYQLERLGKI